MHDKYGAKIAIYSDFLMRVALTAATLLIQGVDIERLNNRYRYPDSPHEITHKNLLDAVDRFAESLRETVTIYSDQLATKERLNKPFLLYKVHSTGGVFPRTLNYIERVEFVKSGHHAGIQVADLCVFLFRRLDDHIETNSRTTGDVQKMWKILAPRINPNFTPRVWRP